MSKRKEIFHHSRIYFSGTLLTQGITLIASILSRRFLGPLQTGIWSTLQIVVDYSKYSTLGVMEAVARDIPYYSGKGDRVKMDEIKNSAFSFVIFTSLLIAGIVILFALNSKNKFPREVTYGLCLVSAIILLQRINNLLICILRAHKQFAVEARMMVFSSVVNSILVAWLAYFFKIYGFIFAMVFSFIFNIIFLLYCYRFEFKWRLNFRKIFPLIKFGFPLMLIALLCTGLRSIDKIIIAKFMGFRGMGYYTIAIMVCSCISNFTIAASTVLFPYFQEKFSVQDNPRDLKSFLYRSSEACALILPAIIGTAWILTPLLVTWALPQFVSGIPSMKALSISMFFICLTQPYHDFLITIKKYYLIFPILLISIAVSAGFDFYAVRAGWGIFGVAFMSSASSALIFSFFYFVAALYFDDQRTSLSKYFAFMAPAIYFLLLLLLVDNLIPNPSYSLSLTLAQWGLFAFFYIPALWILDRRFELLTLLRQKLSAPS